MFLPLLQLLCLLLMLLLERLVPGFIRLLLLIPLMFLFLLLLELLTLLVLLLGHLFLLLLVFLIELGVAGIWSGRFFVRRHVLRMDRRVVRAVVLRAIRAHGVRLSQPRDFAVRPLAGMTLCLPVMRRRLQCASSPMKDPEEKTREQIKKVRSHPWIPDSVYAFPKQRKEPLTDAQHVRNAVARFGLLKTSPCAASSGLNSIADLAVPFQEACNVEPTSEAQQASDVDRNPRFDL